MKKIMISIRPEWVAKILNGQKTIEIRKSVPKITDDTECEVYIYCTKGTRPLVLGQYNANCDTEYQLTYGWNHEEAKKIWDILNSKVVAKFKLNKCSDITPNYDCGVCNQYVFVGCAYDYERVKIGLSFDQINDYLKGKTGYAWHIEDLEIFDEPKELKDFGMKKPPQSWCYIKGE